MTDIVESLDRQLKANRVNSYADGADRFVVTDVAEARDEIVRLRAELDTKTMNWLANNVADKGEILRAEVKAAEAIAERDRLRDALKDALVSVLGQRDYKADRECAKRIDAALKGDTP